MKPEIPLKAGAVALLLLLAVTACKNPFTPRLEDIPGTGEETPTEWLPLTTHGNVMRNFLFVYNFQESQLSAVTAKALYESLFVAADEPGQQYQFQVSDPLDPDKITLFYSIDEELASNEALFDNVESKGLYLTLAFRNSSSSGYDIERAEDAGTGHEGEDWYVYNYTTRLEMENPTGGFPYLVQGQVIFKIRKCADGRYKIVRWIDLTTPQDT